MEVEITSDRPNPRPKKESPMTNEEARNLLREKGLCGLVDDEVGQACVLEIGHGLGTHENYAFLLAENKRLRACLEWLDAAGGLGLEVHGRIRKALTGP